MLRALYDLLRYRHRVERLCRDNEPPHNIGRDGNCDQLYGGFDDLQCAVDECLYLTICAKSTIGRWRRRAELEIDSGWNEGDVMRRGLSLCLDRGLCGEVLQFDSEPAQPLIF